MDHVCFVVLDPEKDPHHVVVANFTKDGEKKDKTCPVKWTEHKALNCESVVAYDYAYVTDLAVIQDEHKRGMAERRDSLDPSLLSRATEGFAKSKRASFESKYYLRAQGLIR